MTTLTQSISQKAIPEEVLALIPEELRKMYALIPIDFTSTGVLTVATSSYEDTLENLSVITKTLQKDNPSIIGVHPVNTDATNFNDGYLTHYRTTFAFNNNNNADNDNKVVATTAQEALFNRIMQSAIDKNASDIHIIPSKNNTLVSFRIDGQFTQQNFNITISDEMALSNLFKTKGKMKGNNLVPEDGQLIFNNEYEVRVNSLPYGRNTGRNIICARIIGRNDGIKSLETLSFTEDEAKSLRRIAAKPNGIFLICGPTSEGKSTTLYSLLKEIQIKKRCKIITIENPIEKYLDGIAQSETHEADTNSYSFADALRACLRQDPDVIMVGEIRDAETANIANIASQTGHLILSTLHVLNSIGVFQRLSDMGTNSRGFAEQVIGIASQRLLPVLCPHCKQRIESNLNADLRQQDLDLLEDGKFSYMATGCDKCNHTGISGRIPIIEIIEFNNYLKDFFRHEHGLVETEIFLRNNTSFKSLWQKGFDQVAKGNVSLDALLSTITRDEDLTQCKEGVSA